MAKNKRRTVLVAVAFIIIACLTGVKHLRANGGFSMDQEGNITNVDAKRFGGEIVVPSEIDGVTVKSVSLDGIEGIKTLELDQAKHLVSVRINDLDIEQLDTSRNSELRQIWISKTGVKSLDTSENKELEALGCADNEIEGLNVLENSKLKYIDCSGNSGLTSLDISKNKALKTVYVDPNVNVQGDLSVVQHYDKEKYSIEE